MNQNNDDPKEVIKVSEIYKYFLLADKSKFYALNGVSLSITKGELVLISGANGSGKSLLMQIIAKLQKQSAGAVYTSSKPGIVFQDAEASILGDTPLDDVMFGLSNIGIRKEKARRVAEENLEKVDLLIKKDNPARMLSGGEKRRLAIASVVAMGFDTIILDEPYSNMDYNGVCLVNKVVRSLKDEGKTIIILSHEIEKCLGLSDRFIVLYKGKITYNGDPNNISNLPLEEWGIKNPIASYNDVASMVWE